MSLNRVNEPKRLSKACSCDRHHLAGPFLPGHPGFYRRGQAIGMVSIKAGVKRFLQRRWDLSAQRSADWAGHLVALLRSQALLDVGCGDGSKLFHYLQHLPPMFCGIEASPAHAYKAAKRGLDVTGFDLNGPWRYPDCLFDVIHCTFVIEHLHHTRLFALEAFRVLKPGGTLVLVSENLCSFINLFAMAMGYTPFTLANCCGWVTGNPLGLHHGTELPSHIPITDPAFSGVSGHVRALSVPQAQDLFTKAGFNTHAFSIGLIPRWLEKLCPGRGHFLCMQATKP